MNIRSITIFCAPGWPPDEATLRQAGRLARTARQAFEAAGYTVQTTRLALPPFPHWLPVEADAPGIARDLEKAACAEGFEYISFGPALPDAPWSYACLPDIVAATQNIFVSGVMASPAIGIDLRAVHACAKVIHTLAPQQENGFANLYFAALANVPPGAPFLPAAYHDGNGLAFALALEAADLAVTAFQEAATLQEARTRLLQRMEKHAAALSAVAEILSRRFEARFGGLDYSLAPYPERERSLGAAIEALGIPATGLHGSLAAAALLAETIDRAEFPRTGFSGLMLPVLEDAVLAERAAQGTLSVKDMLLYSAVCGTGLDTLPLPGDTSEEQLYAILLDVAALSTRLRKPLTARLMPMPGLLAGASITFDFPYFASSRVLGVEALPLQGVLSGKERFSLQPRPSLH
ncbi:MAG: DUF711 family protein [Anaerolineae bacterium]|nr:MAG: DUF711 family protein [Anaerolineae bacterium]